MHTHSQKTRTPLHTPLHTHTRARAHTHTHTRTHARTHTRTHTHTPLSISAGLRPAYQLLCVVRVLVRMTTQPVLHRGDFLSFAHKRPCSRRMRIRTCACMQAHTRYGHGAGGQQRSHLEISHNANPHTGMRVPNKSSAAAPPHTSAPQPSGLAWTDAPHGPVPTATGGLKVRAIAHTRPPACCLPANASARVGTGGAGMALARHGMGLGSAIASVRSCSTGAESPGREPPDVRPESTPARDFHTCW